MHTILAKQNLNADVQRYTVHAPEIAAARKPGQIVIIRLDDTGERIPLTIVSSDTTAGSIDIISQAVGKTTHRLSLLQPGDAIRDVVGPLGKPTHIERFGAVAVVGGGVGIAPLLPITTALKEAGNTVYTILGARTKDLIILEHDMAAVSDQVILTTDDGSAGKQGLVTDRLKELIDGGTHLDLVVAVGPVVMMKAVAELTRPLKIKTMVSLNPIMVDGTGMCGACRCLVAGKVRYACVEGPEFDGHEVDFDALLLRQRMFKKHERLAYEKCKNIPGHKGT